MVRTRECTQEDINTESGLHDKSRTGFPVANPTYHYFLKELNLHGFLSQQFPPISSSAPLGLIAFALTIWVYSMSITGAIIDLHATSQGVFFRYWIILWWSMPVHRWNTKRKIHSEPWSNTSMEHSGWVLHGWYNGFRIS